MSFGFPDEKDPDFSAFSDAILQAHAAKVLMFAAASNSGAYAAAPAFPARLSNVFCVYAGDGMGQLRAHQPDGTQQSLQLPDARRGGRVGLAQGAVREPVDAVQVGHVVRDAYRGGDRGLLADVRVPDAVGGEGKKV